MRIKALPLVRLAQLTRLAGLMFVTGCQSDRWLQLYRYHTEEPAPVRLLIEGKEVAKLDWGAESTSITLTAQQTAVVDRIKDKYKVTKQNENPFWPRILVPAEDPALSLQMSTPDGWTKYPVGLGSIPDNEAIFVSMTQRVGSQGDEHAYVPNVTLYLDNRDCPKSELAYGQLKIIFPKDTMTGLTDIATHLTVPAARVAENIGVSLNGQRVGSIDIGPASHGDYLFDCSGKRSYRWREVLYCPEHVPCSAARVNPTPDELMSGKYLYRLPGGVVNFIKPASFWGARSNRSFTETELVEVNPK